MAWETRPTSANRYYTRSRKVRGRVVREYVGTGLLAELTAAEDRLHQEAREQAAAERRTEQERLAALDAPVLALGALGEALVAATLVASGFRQHARGEWRRRRGEARVEGG